jgi:hypothetical protein
MSQINVNKIADKTGGGAPEFPYGIQVTGIVTATTLNQNVVGVVTASGGFSGALTGNVTGNATGLSGTPNIVVGIVTATSFEGSGANLTGLPAGFTELDAALFN